VIGATVILCGLALFALFGDPAGGRESAPGDEWAIAIAMLALVCAVLLLFGGRGGLVMKAAVYGTVAGTLFGLSAALTKPTLEYLHAGLDELLSHWEPYALAIAGVLGFILQQVSLGTGRLAPSVATRLGCEPRRRHPARHRPARGAAEQARLARRRRLHRPRTGAHWRSCHLSRP
jgi:hypothetical protein